MDWKVNLVVGPDIDERCRIAAAVIVAPGECLEATVAANADGRTGAELRHNGVELFHGDVVAPGRPGGVSGGLLVFFLDAHRFRFQISQHHQFGPAVVFGAHRSNGRGHGRLHDSFDAARGGFDAARGRFDAVRGSASTLSEVASVPSEVALSFAAMRASYGLNSPALNAVGTRHRTSW